MRGEQRPAGGDNALREVKGIRGGDGALRGERPAWGEKGGGRGMPAAALYFVLLSFFILFALFLEAYGRVYREYREDNNH